MARWADFQREDPELAGSARAFFNAGRHRTIATLDPEGGPRLSGIECWFAHGDLWFGSMWQSPKARDLQRDPRLALHSSSADPPDWTGDAKLRGRASEVVDETERSVAMLNAPAEAQESDAPFHLYRVEVDEVTVIRMGEPADHLLATTWRPGRGARTIRLD